MYYPIIDKLKEVMADISSVKDKEPLFIEGTVTSATGGIWTGNWDDIVSAFNTNRPVYFSVTIGINKFSIPIICVSESDGLHHAESGIIYFNQKMAHGLITSNNVFYLQPIQ